jgi:hypothetical protein
LPVEILVAIDQDRSEPLPDDFRHETAYYKTGLPWENYEARHRKWLSDYSIGLGMKLLVQRFLESSCTHFLSIDSDVMLDDRLVKRIRSLDYDYLQIGVPGRTREGMRPIVLQWESTNFGVSRRVAGLLYSAMDYKAETSYPVDLKLHRMIEAIGPDRRFKIQSPYLATYIKIRGRTTRITGVQARILGDFDRQIMRVYNKLRMRA